MSKEVVFIMEPDVGRVAVELSNAPSRTIDDLKESLGIGNYVNCGKPNIGPANAYRNGDTTVRNAENGFCIWLYGLYHNSVVDGPGRRSVIQVSGCSIQCPGCYVPQTHKRENGTLVSIASIVGEIVSNRADQDGVTILGGEPFDQPDPVAEIVYRLKREGLHIAIYSGYTLGALIERDEPSVQYILAHTDLLIDGPFIAETRENAGEYRGSRNQRLVDLQTLRQ